MPVPMFQYLLCLGLWLLLTVIACWAESLAAFLIGTGALAAAAYRTYAGQCDNERQRDALEATIESHLDTLRIRRLQCCRIGPYGVVETRRWDQERRHFASHVLGLAKDDPAYAFALETIESATVLAQAAHELKGDGGGLAYRADMDGLAYERYCAAQLQARGFTVEGTPGSGDQGADLVAVLGARRLVFQCKHWAKPVGNKAVQETVAAIDYYHADAGYVVSNAPYTEQAQALAAANRVMLLHHEQLRDHPF